MKFNGIKDVLKFACEDLLNIKEILEERIENEDLPDLDYYMDAITYLITVEDHIKFIKSEVFVTRK